MKKIILLGWLIGFLPMMVFAHEEIEAPVWNVGDKWAFGQGGVMEVIKADDQYYLVNFSGGIFPHEASGVAIIEKPTLNITHVMNGNSLKKYRDTRKNILNFPLTLGKEWEDQYRQYEMGSLVKYNETFRVLWWDEVTVPAGKFKAVIIENKIEPVECSSMQGCFPRPESKAFFWYSPEAKNIVKCLFEKGYYEGFGDAGARKNWELVSYELKK
jgi:hypothetical protein